MLKLYYWPGACSMASHIVLEEAGAQYDSQIVALSKGEQRSSEYLKINPHGRVPALQIDQQTMLTENSAIMTYVAKSFPAKNLLPNEPLRLAQCISLMSFFASSVHIAFAHTARPERYASDATAHSNVKETNKKAFFDYCKGIDGMLVGKTWIAGDYSVCDPYALVFYWWATRSEMPVKELKAYTAHKDRLLARPAVKKVLEQEQIPLEAS